MVNVAGLDALSARERAVLALLAEGRSNAAIAAALGLTPKTVENVCRRLYQRLGVAGDGATHPRVRAALVYVAATGEARAVADRLAAYFPGFAPAIRALARPPP